jgi:hypothetical protein
MSSKNTITRRAFVSSGASLLAAGAALIIEPRVYGATSDSGHASMHNTANKEERNPSFQSRYGELH